MKKILTILAVLIIIITSVWFFNRRTNTVQLQQQSNQINNAVDTSDWSFYESESYRFKYPKNSEARINFYDQSADVTLWNYFNIPESPDNKEAVQGIFNLGIKVQKQDNLDNDLIRAWVTENVYSERNAHIPNVEKNITVGGKKAYYSSYDYDGWKAGYKFTEFSIYVVSNGYLYIISGTKPFNFIEKEWQSHPYYKQLEQAVKIQEEIIDSFQFFESKN